MTKQEWIKRIEILMLTGRDCFGGCEEYGCTDCQDKAKEVYEGIEQDLLKEFVAWEAKQYKDLYYKYDKEMEEVKDDTDYFWCSGRVAGIGEIRRRLKKDLENFLKEREK